MYWSATLPHKSPHVANAQVNGNLNPTLLNYLIKSWFPHLRKTLSKLSRINANLPCYQCTSSHDDLYVLHNHLSCHPGWVKLYFGWVKSFTIIYHCVCVFYHHIPLCVWLVQVISKWACRNMPWKVQVEHWVFRNKQFAIVALWWLKNSWNRCALFFNISV